MKFNLKHFSYLLLAAGMILTGCSKSSTEPDQPEQELSSNNSISSFSFKADKNSSISVNTSGVQGSGIIYVTVKEGVALNALVPTFKIHEKAVAKIGNDVIKSDETVIDFSKTQTITVTAENGRSASYQILVRNGNDKIDKKIYSFMISHNVPGISMAISANEETVYVGAYGYADKSRKVRVNENTLFRLASMSKQHAAIAIMTLYEKGLLDLDDTVFGKGGLLEEEFGDDMHESWKRITLRDLLSHSGGIYEDCIFPSVSGYSGLTVRDRIKRLMMEREKQPKYAIGTHDYNNANFGILGVVVEEITGKGFIQYLKEDVYGPEGINDIYGGKNDEADTRENETLYYGQDGKNPYGNNVEEGVAAGGVIASTPALMQLMARIDGGTKVPDILKPETIEEMCTAQPGMKNTSGNAYKKYALGWRCNYTDFPSWVAFHGGTLAGVATIWARSKDNVNGVILCNSRSYNQSMDDEMWAVLKSIQDMF
jgi:CubicO group peptidase (beta-lactamase class C family)